MNIFTLAFLASHLPHFGTALGMIFLAWLMWKLAYNVFIDCLELRARIETQDRDFVLQRRINELRLIATRRQLTEGKTIEVGSIDHA